MGNEETRGITVQEKRSIIYTTACTITAIAASMGLTVWAVKQRDVRINALERELQAVQHVAGITDTQVIDGLNFIVLENQGTPQEGDYTLMVQDSNGDFSIQPGAYGTPATKYTTERQTEVSVDGSGKLRVSMDFFMQE